VKKKNLVLHLVLGAMVAAMYVALVGIFQWSSFAAVQFRIAEALTVLPALFGAAIPGVSVGCLLANLLWSPAGWLDWILGPIATLLAAGMTHWLGRRKWSFWLAPIPPIVVNAIIIGIALTGVQTDGTDAAPMLLNIATVGAGQAVVCFGLGLPLLLALRNLPFLKKLRK